MNGERVVIKWCQRKGNAMSDDDMKAELERLRSENAALKKGVSDGTRMKVSEKGAVSVYGMGRFPVTLYKEQWLKLLNMSEEIRAFIDENEARLKAKDWQPTLPSRTRPLMKQRLSFRRVIVRNKSIKCDNKLMARSLVRELLSVAYPS
jgi:hypothetical protein